MEVVISAALLAAITIGTLTAFDAGNRFTTNEQQRSQANDLAQQDQDRLRGMTVTQLSSLNQTRTVTLNGTTFTIVSKGQFERDTTGTSSCAANGSADYIHTTSTVTWPSMGQSTPPVAESIITPPAGGSLIVQVVDSNGVGVQNMSVTGSGTGPLTATTGSDGCAIVGGLAGGSYNVSVAQAGFVDKDGNTTPPTSQQAVTVIVGSTATKTFYFDHAGSLSTTFDTKPYGAATPVPVNGDTLTVFNNNMTFPGYRYFGTAGTYSATLNATNLFPFPSAYTVFAGSCAADAPSAFGQGPDPSVVVPQGGSASGLALHLPPLNLSVLSGISSLSPGSPLLSANVVITDTGCTPNVRRVMTTNSSGQLVNPGLPFGTYTVCADANILGVRLHVSVPGVVNSNLSGTPVNLYLGGGSLGACP
jgi:uncharacterized protein YdeI (BOF family)